MQSIIVNNTNIIVNINDYSKEIGPDGVRTHDLRLIRAVLYQLSYRSFILKNFFYQIIQYKRKSSHDFRNYQIKLNNKIINQFCSTKSNPLQFIIPIYTIILI